MVRQRESGIRKFKDVAHYGHVIGAFNPDLPVLLMCDASLYGIGTVLAHRMPDGSERPIIGYVSRSLSKAERNESTAGADASVEASYNVASKRSLVTGLQTPEL